MCAVHVVWGSLTAVIGVAFVVWASTTSSFVVYRALAARSRLLWGDQVHRFYQVVGVILVVLGVLWATGIIWSDQS
jgi:drug/metabolite transporter (DMT)-like permease